MKKKPNKVLIIILAVIVVLAVFKNVAIKVVAENGIKAATGFGLDMGSFKLSFFKSHVDIKDLKLLNPKDFEEPIMVDIPEIYLDVDLLSVLTNKVHVKDVRFHLKEMVVVTNKEGDTNVNRLKGLQPEKKEDEAAKKEKPKDKKKKEITIDHLVLKVDQVRMVDYSKGGDKPTEKVIKVSLDYEAEDITNVTSLASFIVAKTMMSAGLSNLMAIDPTGVLSGVGGVVGDAAGKVGDAAGKVTGAAGEAVGKTTESLKGLIKNPFGSKE